MYKLVIQDDEGKTTVVPLIRDELTIGRKEGNTIRLTERNVSRSHARLTKSNSTVVIEDLGSYNGIRVNGSRIQGRATIAETDRVQIGDYLIEIRSAARAESSPSDETQPVERIGHSDPVVSHSSPPPNPLAAESGAMPATPVVVPAVSAREAIGVADTDPGRAINVANASPSVSNQGRLVVISTNFAGQEFILDKPAMVIGRTDENDVWLDHRSISRHHAKVVLENGRYSIEDLQSSNGVRVNGEEYGKVELRRADVIDLGHVRLRFVEPGEDFVFGRDAQAVDVFPEGGNKLWLYLGLGAVAIGGVIAAVLLHGGGHGEKQTIASNSGGIVVTRDGGGGSDGSTLADNTAADAGLGSMEVEDATPVLDPAQEKERQAHIDKLLAEANRHFKAKRWNDAINSSNSLLALDEGNPGALMVADKAAKELTASENLAELKRVQAENPRAYAEIKRLQDSVANTSAAPAAARIANIAKRQEFNTLRKSIKNSVSQKDCDQARKTANRAVFPLNRRNLKKKISCGSVAVTDPNGGEAPDVRGTSAGPTTEELRSQLSVLARQGSRQGFRMCDALASKGGLETNDILKCGALACRIRDASKAKKYRRMLRSQKKKGNIDTLCINNDVTLD